MNNTLIEKGILLPSGEINKDKINLVAGAATKPFADMVWVSTNGDKETINRMTDIFVKMNTPQESGRLFQIIQMLYGLLGIIFPAEAALMSGDPRAVEYFNFSFLCDFGEIIKDYISEEQEAAL
jgi:hypothetical protein